MNDHPLDNVLWHALTGEQARFALGTGKARRFQTGIGPLAGIADRSEQSLADLAALIRALGPVALLQPGAPLPPIAAGQGIRIVKQAEGVQMVYAGEPLPPETSGPDLKLLGPEAYPEMLALASLTEPGPFAARTADLGQFWGVFDEARLIAMAGQRTRPTGHIEVSGVCTHPDARGRGLASRLTRRVVRQILANGRIPFLHAYADNGRALALYRQLGFAERTRVLVTVCATAP